MDHETLLPSKESLRRFYERALALYEQPQAPRRRRKKEIARDISEYQVDEAAPDERMEREKLLSLFHKAAARPKGQQRMREYIKRWTGWVGAKCSLTCDTGWLIGCEAVLDAASHGPDRGQPAAG
jgi:hypothetical protein